MTHELDAIRLNLINMITHQLRTPLNVIYGSRSVLTEELATVSGETTQMMLDLLKAGAQQMKRIVDRMPYMAQITEGHLERLLSTDRVYTNLNTVIETVYAEHNDTTLHSDIQVILDLDEEVGLVRGIEKFIKFVVSELLDNAVNASRPGQ